MKKIALILASFASYSLQAEPTYNGVPMEVWHQVLTYHHDTLVRRNRAVMVQDEIQIVYLQGKIDAFKEVLDFMGDRIPGELE